MTRGLVLLLALGVPALVPRAATAQVALACVSLPSNIEVPGNMEQWIEGLIAQSTTLQRQCAAIAASDRVIVQLSSSRISSQCRARTSFWRDRDGRLRAAVEVPVSADFAELFAHELEHVIEQIEGLDLARLARRRQSGVWEVASNVFETARAIDAGLAAAGEARTCGNGGPLCPRGRLTTAAAD